MTSAASSVGECHQLRLGEGSRPVLLSSIQLPLQPSSSSNTTDATSKYVHVLPSQAISPRMDLIALLSRDVAPPSSAAANGSAALNPSSVLAPPPPGMSAAANQARIRMMMMARARALAAAGLPANAAGPSAVEAPKVTRCASIRLSLWRMASLAGEQGSRVWDVEVKVPDLFKDAEKDVKETEDVSVSTLSWSPDSRSIAITVLVNRRRVEGTARRQNRFLLVYDMQDGKQKRVIPISSEGQASGEGITGLEWCQLASKRQEREAPGSAAYILKRLKALPDTSQFTEEKDTKARQRQRAFNAMRNTSQKQGEEDRKLKDEMLSDSENWSTCLLDFPRSDGVNSSDEEMNRNGTPVAVLCAWEGHRLHLFLDGSIYLGSIAVGEQIHSVNIVSRSGHLSLCTARDGGMILQTMSTGLDHESVRFSTLLHLQSLSTQAFDLLTYFYDGIVDIRNLYRNTHINCITPWFKKGKSIEIKYSTHFQTEMQMLLLTSSANEAITSLLVGNETMTEGDLNKMKTEIASAWIKAEALFESVFQALQRIDIVFEEVRGCWLWQERYAAFLPNSQGHAIEKIASLVSQSQQQALTSLRHVQQEMRCWSQFYNWFKYERVRQEAIRDQVAEPKLDISFDVVLIAGFLKRGFVNHHLEASIGIVLDRKTRGTFVENDEEEEEEKDEEAAGIDQDESKLMGQSISHQQAEAMGSKKDISHNDLLEMQKQMREIPDTAGKSTIAAPSQADISCLVSSPFILTGPSKGLHERQHLSASGTTNIFAVIKELLKSSSALFSQAFASYVSQDYKVSKVDVAIDFPLTPLRSDALLSVARQGGSAEAEVHQSSGSHLVRSCFDQAAGQQWLIGSCQEGDHSKITIVAHTLALNTVKKASIQCQGRIVDIGFYSSHEVVVLLQDDKVTRMLSFSLESLNFTSSQAALKLMPTQRCYDMVSDQAGAGALQLSLNHAKDVAATIDNKGMLIYWDFVQLSESKDEDHEMVSNV